MIWPHTHTDSAYRDIPAGHFVTKELRTQTGLPEASLPVPAQFYRSAQPEAFQTGMTLLLLLCVGAG